MIIVAGPNGSGKTTFAKKYLQKLKIKNFLNSDELARGLSIVDPQSQIIESGKILLRQLKKFIEQKTDFAIETTLSGNYLERYMRQAKKVGYEIRLIYLHTSDVNVNIKRIHNRRVEGGHFVPSKDVRRRYTRSLEYMSGEPRKLCDILEIYDAMVMPPQPVFMEVKETGLRLVDYKKQDIWKDMVDDLDN